MEKKKQEVTEIKNVQKSMTLVLNFKQIDKYSPCVA